MDDNDGRFVFCAARPRAIQHGYGSTGSLQGGNRLPGGGRGRAFARNSFRTGHADRRHGSIAGQCTQKGMGGPLSQRELSATTDKDKFVLRLPERPVQREKEVPRWYRPARAGRQGAVHDGGCGREGRAGQGIRQVCHPAARQLHGQLLPPLEGTRRQRGGSPSARRGRNYRLDGAQHRRTPAHHLQAQWKKYRPTVGTGLHQIHTEGMRGGIGGAMIFSFG